MLVQCVFVPIMPFVVIKDEQVQLSMSIFTCSSPSVPVFQGSLNYLSLFWMGLWSQKLNIGFTGGLYWREKYSVRMFILKKKHTRGIKRRFCPFIYFSPIIVGFFSVQILLTLFSGFSVKLRRRVCANKLSWNWVSYFVAFIDFLSYGEKGLNVESKCCYRGVGIVSFMASFNCLCLRNWVFQCQATITDVLLCNSKKKIN